MMLTDCHRYLTNFKSLNYSLHIFQRCDTQKIRRYTSLCCCCFFCLRVISASRTTFDAQTKKIGKEAAAQVHHAYVYNVRKGGNDFGQLFIYMYQAIWKRGAFHTHTSTLSLYVTQHKVFVCILISKLLLSQRVRYTIHFFLCCHHQNTTVTVCECVTVHRYINICEWNAIATHLIQKFYSCGNNNNTEKRSKKSKYVGYGCCRSIFLCCLEQDDDVFTLWKSLPHRAKRCNFPFENALKKIDNDLE